jgi:fatty-acid desaturase
VISLLGGKEILNWELMAGAFTIYFLGVIGAAFTYHRMLAHASFRVRSPFREILVLIGLPAGTPLQWVGNHRFHHQVTDTKDDPHSPYFGGFWHAHCGWYIGFKSAWACIPYALAGPLRTLIDAWMRPRTNQDHVHLATDIAKDPFLSWVSRPAIFTIVLHLHVLVAGSFFYWVGHGMGLFVYWLSMVAIYNAGDSVDSIAHLWGATAESGRSQARNNFLITLITAGEGWHANHHLFPSRARQGDGSDFEPMWLFIRVLEELGIVYQVKR